jgi:hypothetical protein
VGDGKGVYAADGLKVAVKAWENGSGRLNKTIRGLLKMGD